MSSTLLVTREAFMRVRGFSDLRMNEDYELTLRLALRYSASYVPDVLVHMRQHPGRTSMQSRETPLLDYITIVESFLSSNRDLPADVKSHGKKGLANVHFKLACFYLETGNTPKARRHLGAMLHSRPLDRRGLYALARTLRQSRAL